MMAACYDLRLECDAEGGCNAGAYGSREVAEWNFETGGACRRAARRAGWKFSMRTGLCLCPKCAKRGAKAVL